MSFALRAYSLLGVSLTPALMLGMFLSKRGQIRFGERLGEWQHIPESCLWFHGASRGELEGLAPLVHHYKNAAKIISCTSPSGLEVAQRLTSDIRILPLDIGWCIRRALKESTPKKFIFGETELWPQLINTLSARGTDLHLVNARISNYTFSRYYFFRPLVKETLQKLTSICVADELSADRFVRLGADAEKVFMTGNCKYDRDRLEISDPEKNLLRSRLFAGIGEDEVIVTLGSLRPGEERLWFGAYRVAVAKGLKIKLIVAPRHLEKADFFCERLSSHEISFSRWSELPTSESKGRSAVLIDRFGILETLYSVSDAAFIGATLEDFGGHNPLEAARNGTYVVVGPHLSNISVLIDELEQVNAVTRLRTQSEILDFLEVLATTPELIRARGRCGIAVAMRHTGATQRVLEVLGEVAE